MKLLEIGIKNHPPVERFEAEGLSNAVVVAGPNGVGKTRLLAAILNLFRNPSPNETGYLVLSPTSDAEKEAWNNKVLRTDSAEDADLIRKILHSGGRRIKWTSSVINIESDRTIQPVKPFQFTWEIPDPDEENLGWDITLSPLHNRWPDTQHAIFRKIFSLKNQLGARAMNLGLQGHDSMNLKFKDPLRPFRDAFFSLLAPKELVDPDLQNQILKYKHEGNILDISTLSSGEKEVLSIVFDIVLRSPSHCVFTIDEPELHLHPELSQKLLSVLSSIGESNQFIYFSHSPEIISSSIEDTVLFMRPPDGKGGNQAVFAGRDDESVQALRLLGQSIGVISLGRKIVLIEGGASSTDKKVYSRIVAKRFPGFVLLPVGSVRTLHNFEKIKESILDKAIWGVEFFMLCDGDAPYADDLTRDHQEYPRLRKLGRYHIENYFLDARVWKNVFKSLETEHEWLLDEESIEDRFISIAKKHTSYAAALIVSRRIWESVGRVHLVPKACDNLGVDEFVKLMREQASQEIGRVAQTIGPTEIESMSAQVFEEVGASFQDDSWKSLMPGRPILKSFLAEAKIHDAHVKSLYISQAMASEQNPFQEVLNIFNEFDQA